MPTSSEVYRLTIRLRFGQCDMAGIAFYPRLVEMVTVVQEDWFGNGLGLPFHDLHHRSEMSVPTVTTTVDFPAPVRLGDLIAWTLTVAELGRTSATLAIDGRVDERLCVRARPKIVHCTIAGGELRAVPWPADVRARIERYVEHEVL